MEAKGSDGGQTGGKEPAEAETMEDEQPRKLDESAYDGDGLSAIDRQYAAQTDVPRQIHILGASGSIGKLIAHSLRGLDNPPPISLIFHRYKLIEQWQEQRSRITLEDNGHESARRGFAVELLPERKMQHNVDYVWGHETPYDRADREGIRPDIAAKMMAEERKNQPPDHPPDQPIARQQPGEPYVRDEPIHNLIVTVKAMRTLNALNPIAHRLLPTSTICFLQNGMGVIDELNTHLFPDPAIRPNYMQGILTHGAHVPPAKAEQNPFYVVHAGHGTIALGLLPREGATTPQARWAPSSRYLLRTLARSPVLCAVGFTPTELLQQQLEKLAVNSVINPLTALLDNRNGALLFNFALTRTMRLLLAETSHVIRSLPELRGIPNVNVRFSPERLEALVVRVADQTQDNISSTLADVRAGLKTELEYINGYIVKRGEELGVKCVVNYAMMQAVMGKTQMVNSERREEVPRVKEMMLEG